MSEWTEAGHYALGMLGFLVVAYVAGTLSLAARDRWSDDSEIGGIAWLVSLVAAVFAIIMALCAICCVTKAI